jgi:hypothetical protein
MAPINIRPRNRWFAAAALATSCLISVAYALTSGVEGDKEQSVIPFDDLLAQDEQTRDRAVDKILEDRKLVIERLIPIIDPANAAKHNNETRCAAAYLLGEMRAVEAVPILASTLAKPPGRQFSSTLSRYYDGPVFNALIKIGRPAVPAMIQNLESSDHPAMRESSLGVLLHVLGGNTRLLEVLGKVHDRAVKQNRPPIIARRIAEAKKWAEEHYGYPPGSEEPLY